MACRYIKKTGTGTYLCQPLFLLLKAGDKLEHSPVEERVLLPQAAHHLLQAHHLHHKIISYLISLISYLILSYLILFYVKIKLILTKKYLQAAILKNLQLKT